MFVGAYGTDYWRRPHAKDAKAPRTQRKKKRVVISGIIVGLH